MIQYDICLLSFILCLKNQKEKNRALLQQIEHIIIQKLLHKALCTLMHNSLIKDFNKHEVHLKYLLTK